MLLYRYKPEEGRFARQSAFWLGVGWIFYGCYALSGELTRWESLRGPVSTAMPEIPLLGIPLTGAFLVSTLLFLAGAFAYVRWLSRDQVAQYLIEVESEMRKVTWPSFEEAVNSSVVVIFTVLFLMGFLALADFVFGWVFDVVLWSRYGA